MRIHVFQGPGFLGSSFFRLQLFQSLGSASRSRFFRDQVQGSVPGFRSSPLLRYGVRTATARVFKNPSSIYSGSTSQNDGNPNRKRTLTDPPADQCLQYKRFKIVKDEVTHNWGIFYKADPDVDSDLQRKRTMDLQKKWTLWVLVSNMTIISLNCNLKHSQIGHFLSQM